MTHFWESKSLAQMSKEEWESLCDGCARCCMIKLQDEDTDEVHYTSIVCDLLDQHSCQCTAYPQRHALVEDCVVLTYERVGEFHWLPKSCAYRTLAEGRPLAWWHPLVSGTREYHSLRGATKLRGVLPPTFDKRSSLVTNGTPPRARRSARHSLRPKHVAEDRPCTDNCVDPTNHKRSTCSALRRCLRPAV